MRTLAQRLGSGTATLYRHFENRAALVAHVIDHVFGEIEIDARDLAALGWREACRTLARSMFDVLSRHRGVAQLLLEFLPSGPNAMAQRERSIALLLDNGFPIELAARAYATLARYVLGFAIQLGDQNGSRDEDLPQADIFRSLDKSRFPATFAVAAALPVPLEEEFSFGLELMIAGLGELQKTNALRA